MGVVEEESELEEIVLWPVDEGGQGVGVRTRRMGLAHPRMYLSFVSLLCITFLFFSSGDEG